MPSLILASGSPRRIEMMSKLTDDFIVSVPDIDETPVEGETPEEMVLRLSAEKAGAVHSDTETDLPVLAADTIVVLDGVLGKPNDENEAFEMLRLLSGKTHEVITGVTLIEGKSGKIHSFTEKTEVVFSTMSDREINEYIATGDPLDKAGAYGIQDHGGRYIKRIDGCFYNVMGFPFNRIYSLLKKLGII